ncbi:hypothetical protein A5852_003537 [Enterococcus faecium]|nr:hypothetical protein A5852_003537 [Enterococcus faecium]
MIPVFFKGLFNIIVIISIFIELNPTSYHSSLFGKLKSIFRYFHLSVQIMNFIVSEIHLK